MNSMTTYKQLKDRLYSSFLQSKERGLTDEQIKLAKDSAKQGSDQRLSEKYKLLEFSYLVQQNNVSA